MLAYYRFHPDFVKEAGSIRTHLSNFWQNNFRSLKSRLVNLKNPETYRQWAKNNKWNLGIGAGAIAWGAYKGNQAYNNALPPVRMLPDMNAPGEMGVYDQQQYWYDPQNQQRDY